MNSNEKHAKSTIISISDIGLSEMEIKADYNAKVRTKVDDVAKRREFKEKTFDGKKTIKDPYTGDTLHIDSAAAKAKYGKGNASKHTSDVDHIISVKEIYEKTQDNAFVSTQDIKEIVNLEENYKVINSKLNRSKGAGKYSDCSKKNADTASKNKSNSVPKLDEKKMLYDQRKADFAVNTEIAKKTIEGMHKVGTEAAKTGVVVGGGISVAQNTAKVMNGELSLSEAGAEVVIDTVKAGAVSYISGIGVRAIEATAVKAAKNTGEFIATSLNGFVKSGGPAKTLSVISEVGGTVCKYINGELNDKEFATELGTRGTSLAMSFGAGTQGAVAGGLIGSVIGSVVPVVGTTIGAEVGIVVGEVIGNMVGYMLGTEICRVLQEGTDEYEADIERKKRLTKFYTQLAEETEKSRLEMEASLSMLQAEHKKVLVNAFSNMKNAILENDMGKVIDSLQTICNEYGLEVAYKNRQELDVDMGKKDFCIKLGQRNGN